MRVYAARFNLPCTIRIKCFLFPALVSRNLLQVESLLRNQRKFQTNGVQKVEKLPRSSKKTRSFDANHRVKHVLESYPNNLWANHKKFNDLYLADEDVAREVARIICESEHNCMIFEANPGPGVLTKALLECGASQVRVFEKETAFMPALKHLEEQYPSVLDIIEEDIMMLPKLSAKDRYFDGNCTGPIFKDLNKKPWTDDIALKLVSVVCNSRSINFMRFVLAKLSAMSSLFEYGRCKFFLLLSDTEFTRMMARPKGNMSAYRDVTIMYNLFFDIKSISKIPLGAFVPIATSSYKKKGSHNIFFVTLTPKRNLLESVAPLDKLPELYFFIRHHFMKRKSYVIPTLEQWIPWCGPKFIKKGMRVFTRFGDLSPMQILQLFQQFSSLPEYEDSPFRAAVEHFF